MTMAAQPPPSSPNDLAFFYLYDYTTPPRPRKHRRHASQHTTGTTSQLAHIEKATTRRALALEAKRTKVALHNENIRTVLHQYKCSSPPDTGRLDDLLGKMARVEEARESLLRRRGEECARRVEEAKRRAGRVKREREQIARIAGKEIVQRLESAERRRGELLLAKRARGSPTRPNKQAQNRSAAAVKIQRAWRAYRAARAIREFRAQGVSVEVVTQRSFVEVVPKFKAPGTIRAAGRLLMVLELITSDIPEKESASLVRTFLSAYMITGHTKEVLHSHDQPLELVIPHLIPPPI